MRSFQCLLPRKPSSFFFCAFGDLSISQNQFNRSSEENFFGSGNRLRTENREIVWRNLLTDTEYCWAQTRDPIFVFLSRPMNRSKYRLGQQQAKKKNSLEHAKENSENSYGHHKMHILSTSINSSNMNGEQGEIPIVEVLRCQIEVQKRLQEQLEKLQMRIEAQGK